MRDPTHFRLHIDSNFDAIDTTHLDGHPDTMTAIGTIADVGATTS